MKIKPTTNKLFIYLGALLIGLLVSIFIFNAQQDKLIKYDITWNNPHEAIVFWKTSHKTKGYVRYGSSKFNLNHTKDQLSKDPSVLHVVMLDNLPQEEFYISLHSDGDGFFRWPGSISIKYTPIAEDEQS